MTDSNIAPEQIDEWIAFIDQLIQECDPKNEEDRDDRRWFLWIRKLLLARKG